MKRLRRLAVVVSLFFPAAGCGAALPSTSDELAVAAYSADESRCVAEAGVPEGCVDDAGYTVDSEPCQTAKAVANRCVCQVRVRYGRDCDGGAP